MGIIKRFLSLNIYLKIILVFCVIGFVRNFIFLIMYGGIVQDGYRIFIGFLLLYGAQSVLIMMTDRRGVIFSAAQCIFALIINNDFTFLPVVKPVFSILIYFFDVTDKYAVADFQYIMVAFLFTVELLKSYLMYDFFAPQKEESAVAETAREEVV
ncbi:hypothetical protein Dip518_000599 [Parelusimicrobium proximum]|uniref:hypothetical protein n=1 Tax=Parelusimicrobium proximum TaxID=3228953 RepID=UPI003D181D56